MLVILNVCIENAHKTLFFEDFITYMTQAFKGAVYEVLTKRAYKLVLHLNELFLY